MSKINFLRNFQKADARQLVPPSRGAGRRKSRWTWPALAAAAALTVPVPALAQGPSQSELRQGYVSLSASLISAHAQTEGKTLSSFLQDNDISVFKPSDYDREKLAGDVPTLSPLVASGQASLESGLSLISQPVRATSLEELNTRLSAYDVGFSKSDLSSLSSLTKAVLGKSATPDAQLTIAGATWVTDLAKASLPTPAAPQNPGVSIPAGALPFGLLLNQSFANMVAQSPEIFRQVQTGGAGSAAAQAAWSSALASTWENASADIKQTVGDPCTSGMMAVMATGDSSAASEYGCGTACAAGGMYLHSFTQSLFNPKLNSKTPTDIPGVISNFTANSLPASVRAGIVQNQSVSGSQLNELLSSASSGCDVASSGTRSRLSTTFPKMWSSLAAR